MSNKENSLVKTLDFCGPATKIVSGSHANLFEVRLILAFSKKKDNKD